MKNALKYYYDLNAYDIHHIDENYKFIIEDKKYVLYKIQEEINLEDIYELNIYLINLGFKCHKIILNNQNNIMTYINDSNYILMEIFTNYNYEIILNDILEFSKYEIDFKTTLKRENWYNLWTKKIDYLEYQVNHIGKKYPLLVSSFSYFIGMAETSIQLLNEIKEEDGIYTVSHKNIYSNMTLYELYNPLNFIVDLKIRDISEYFKKKFFENKYIYDEINYYLKYSNLTEYDIKMFFVRMIYPSFYFELYEKIIDGSENEKNILKIISKTDDYEIFIKNLYNIIKNYVILSEIEWLKKT